jgi:hypothetical protein
LEELVLRSIFNLGRVGLLLSRRRKAKAQLAAVTAMMDDIEPQDEGSPQIIHVVSYSEAFRLADRM